MTLLIHFFTTHFAVLTLPSLSLLFSPIHTCPKRSFLPAHTNANSTNIPAYPDANCPYLPANTDANTLHPAFKYAHMDPRNCHNYLISGTSPSLSLPVFGPTNPPPHVELILLVALHTYFHAITYYLTCFTLAKDMKLHYLISFFLTFHSIASQHTGLLLHTSTSQLLRV